MSLSKFVSEAIAAIASSSRSNASELLVNCRYLDEKNQPAVFLQEGLSDLIIETPTPEGADFLWELHEILKNVARPYGWNKIVLRGSPLEFNVQVKQPMSPNQSVKILEQSRLPTREKDLLIEAIASDHSFAVVRLRDNCVIQAGQGILKYSNVPAAQWTGFDITSLWVPQDVTWQEYRTGVGPRSEDLEKIYKILEFSVGNPGNRHLNVEYRAFRAAQQAGQITRGDEAWFCSDIYRLDDYFGEPCRLCIAKDSRVIVAK